MNDLNCQKCGRLLVRDCCDNCDGKSQRFDPSSLWYTELVGLTVAPAPDKVEWDDETPVFGSGFVCRHYPGVRGQNALLDYSRQKLGGKPITQWLLQFTFDPNEFSQTKQVGKATYDEVKQFVERLTDRELPGWDVLHPNRW